ncbi:MAG: diaminopimelate decarboxylase [Chromatiales bacterium]|nr:diaminopimelate decarboxylase [Chromatiales bacterium]
MDHFAYRDGRLYGEDVPLAEIAARYGTPTYVYSRATLERHWRAFDSALGEHPHLICYAVKANSNLAVLDILARLGSGFDIVSGGELRRVLAAGGDPAKVVFSGVGKTASEMELALESGVRCFNLESEAERLRLSEVASAHGVVAPVSIRVNPDVDPRSHPYISTGLKENKFGIGIEQAVDAYRRVADSANLEVHGIDCHIGSQLIDASPLLDALDRVLLLAEQLQGEGLAIRHLDLGGGLGVRYRQEDPPQPADYAREVLAKLRQAPYEILLEPGRAIAANAGLLITRVEYLKPTSHKNFAIIDAAMNDLLRPSLYGAYHEVWPLRRGEAEEAVWDLVGPVCETGDFLAKDRQLGLLQGDLLAIRSAGAYGFAMSSNYNSRPRAAEIVVDGDRCHLARRRESFDDLIAGESRLPD